MPPFKLAAALCLLRCWCVAEPGAGPTIEAGPEVSRALLNTANQHLRQYDERRGGGPRLTIALGSSPAAARVVPPLEVAALGSPDAFVVRSGRDAGGGPVLACAGKTARSTGFAFFELLQRLGFAFLHPLKPVRPGELPRPVPALDVMETPRWEVRGTHYHTQHPLELTNFLNGYDLDGSRDDRQKWMVAFPMWEAFLDWMLAQKQNYIEWMLLTDRLVAASSSGAGGGDFELSAERQARLQLLLQAAHDRGIEVGADVPLTLRQQHAMNLLPSPTGQWQQDAREVTRRIRWLLACGFDHLGTELGTTEFTQGLAARDLVYMLNVTKELLGPARRLLVKNHCSTKQKAEGFRDPRPGRGGEDLNFNYLSYYADPEVVAMPHTVQVYSLKDPAPTYGNADFSDLRDWTRFLLKSRRPVVFYPETAYWVNYDIPVPLFLAPLYAKARVDDANDIDAMGGLRPVLGQLNFESGWEWGYWLANAAQAAVTWQKTPDTKAVFDRLLRFMQPDLRARLVDLLVDFAEAQHRLLVGSGSEPLPAAPGTGNGSPTGIAYLQGSEGLSDLGALLARYLGKGAPQPDRLRFCDLWTGPPTVSLEAARLFTGISNETVEALSSGRDIAPLRRQWFRKHLRPLLSEMNDTFHLLSQRFEALEPALVAVSESLGDLVVSARLLSLRCEQVLALYDHAVDCGPEEEGISSACDAAWCSSRLAAARGALRVASDLVPGQEAQYGLVGFGINHSLVSQWRAPVPTAYSYGYLWAVHHLFYWQRDQAIVERRICNPCFAAINDPVELAFQGGGGTFFHFARRVVTALFSNRFWHAGLADCIKVPDTEPNPLAGGGRADGAAMYI